MSTLPNFLQPLQMDERVEAMLALADKRFEEQFGFDPADEAALCKVFAIPPHLLGNGESTRTYATTQREYEALVRAQASRVLRYL